MLLIGARTYHPPKEKKTENRAREISAREVELSLKSTATFSISPGGKKHNQNNCNEKYVLEFMFSFA